MQDKAIRRQAQFLLPAALLLAGLYLAVKAAGAVFPLILSAALAYLLNPLVRYFEVRGIKRLYAVVGLYLAAGAILATVIYLVVYLLSFELESLQETWPVYARQLEVFVSDLNTKMVTSYPMLSGLNLPAKMARVLEAVPAFILGLLPMLSLLFLVPFITFFVLLGGSGIIDYILDHIPSRHSEIVLHVTSRIDESLGNYLRGILTEAFIIFLIAFSGLVIMGINYASAIAIIIGFSSLVPYLGAFVGAALASVVAYFQFGTFLAVFKVLMLFAGIRFFDDWFLQPYIMKRAVKLNPAVIVFALMAGWELGGIWGVVFSIPVTCIIKETLAIAIELQETEFQWKPAPEPTRISIPYT
jgi:predicted PurR-regulated permease PerM